MRSINIGIIIILTLGRLLCRHFTHVCFLLLSDSFCPSDTHTLSFLVLGWPRLEEQAHLCSVKIGIKTFYFYPHYCKLEKNIYNWSWAFFYNILYTVYSIFIVQLPVRVYSDYCSVNYMVYLSPVFVMGLADSTWHHCVASAAGVKLLLGKCNFLSTSVLQYLRLAKAYSLSSAIWHEIEFLLRWLIRIALNYIHMVTLWKLKSSCYSTWYDHVLFFL